MLCFSMLLELPATQEISDILKKAPGDITEDDLILIGELQHGKSPSVQFYTLMREKMLAMKDQPVLSLLELSAPHGEDKRLSRLIAAAEYKDNSKVCSVQLLNKW